MRLAQKTTLATSQTTKTKQYDNKTKTRWMVSNNTDSGVDFAYGMPESIVAALGSQGFAEAARAFQSIGGEEVPAAMRSQISLVIPQAERVVTTDDIQKEIDEFILRVGTSSGTLVDQARAMLSSLVGKPYSALNGMASTLERLTSLAQSANSLSDPETPEARLAHLQATIANEYERQREILQGQFDRGEISRETYEKGMQAIGAAEEANNTHGAGSAEAHNANVNAANVVGNAAAEAERNGGDAGAIGEQRRSISTVAENDRQARDIRAGLNTPDVANDREAMQTVRSPAREVEPATVANTGGMFASFAANTTDTARSNDAGNVRMAYAEASEAEFVPVQATPAVPSTQGTQITQL